MNTFLRFFYEFISIFFDGFFLGFKGMWAGLSKMFGFTEYAKLISNYKDKFNGNEKIFLVICVVFLLIFIVVFILLFVLMIKELIRKFGKNLNNDELLEEIGSLNEQVYKLMKEKDELMAMKVSQLGINPQDEDDNKSSSNDGELDDEVVEVGVRFPSLVKIDEVYKNYKVKNYENNFTLQEFIDDFRCFSASQLGLYYDFTILRPFIAGLACGKLIILQGISGTGKTSLAYAWGKFVKNDSCVTSVEPSWREKTDFLGYFNEFSKKFNETRSLEEIYRSGYDDDIHTIILDEMNLARVEYYFADLLSILEIPNKEEWLVDIVTDSWLKDPKNIVNGKLRLPENLWYIGTINNDDSTFMVTDKVYDRAMPIDINTKIDPFKCREQESVNVNASYLYSLFNEAMEKYPLSPKGEQQIRDIDDYVIKHFRIAFGNRIMKQIKTFSSVYVACGGKEIEAIDYFIAKKILRKFEQLSVAFIRDEIDPFISYLNKNMGKDVMKECIEYLERIKKSI